MSYTDLGAPQSRNEVLLMNMLGATYDVEEPQSRIEYLLKEILENGGGGGTGDVSGVKGALENAFRKGNVTLALQNLATVDNGIYFDELTNIIRGIQYATLPAATASLAGRIYQYTGADAGSYKSGHFYKCIQDGASYKWDDCIKDAEGLTNEQLNDLLSLLD